MAIDENLVRKIRKLLELAKSHNEHEAKLAAEMANDLLLRHNLNVQQLGGHQEFTEREAYESRFEKVEDKYIIGILRRFFFVETYTTRTLIGFNAAGQAMYDQAMMVVGEKTNVEVGIYIYEFLVREFRSLWRSFRKAYSKPAAAQQSYYYGLAHGLAIQLDMRHSKVQQETGLVWVGDKALVEYLKGKNLKSSGRTKLSEVDDQSIEQGFRDGHELKLRQGLNATETSSVGSKPLQIEGKKA